MNRQPLRNTTKEEISAFEQDGIVCVRGQFDRDWVERMQNVVDHLLDRPSPRGFNISADGAPGRHAFDNFLWLINDDFRAFAFDSPAAEIAATLMRSPRVNLLFDFLIVKEPHTPSPTSWHQDMPGNPVEGRQACQPVD